MNFTVTSNDLKHEDEIGFAFLVAEDEGGHYEPIEIVSTLREASEIAAGDMKRRLELLDQDGDPGLCPYQYVLFARTINGRYERIANAAVTA